MIDRSEAAKPESGKKQRSPRQTGIVVGIDFGNTFTGVSYAHQGDGEMIDVVKWYVNLTERARFFKNHELDPKADSPRSISYVDLIGPDT